MWTREEKRNRERQACTTRDTRRKRMGKRSGKIKTTLRDRTRERSRVLREYQMEKWLFYGYNGGVRIRRARHNVTTWGKGVWGAVMRKNIRTARGLVVPFNTLRRWREKLAKVTDIFLVRITEFECCRPMKNWRFLIEKYQNAKRNVTVKKLSKYHKLLKIILFHFSRVFIDFSFSYNSVFVSINIGFSLYRNCA